MVRMSALKPLALAAAALAVSVPASAETVLKFSWFGPPVADFNKNGVFKWGEEVGKVTEGRVRIEFLAKSAGAPPAHFDLIRDGVVDAAYYLPGITRGRFVLHQAAEFPFGGSSAATNSVVYWRTYKKHFEKAGEHKDVQVLTALTHGPGLIHNSKRPIASAKDMKGLKFRVPGETIGTLAKTLGAVPMFASIGQVPQLVTRGVADGVFLPWNAVGDFKLAKTLKYTTPVPGGIYNVTFHVAANPRKWATLSAADRTAIMGISGEAGARTIGGSWDVGDRRGAAYSRSSKAQWTEMGAAFRAEVEKAFRPMRDAWVEAAKAKGVDGEAALTYMREQRAALGGK